MDWTKGLWRRLYCGEPPDQALWDLEVRAMRDHLLRYPVADDGLLFANCHEPIASVLQLVRCPTRKRKFWGRAVQELLRDGFLAHGADKSLRIKNFALAQQAASKEALRKRESRASGTAGKPKTVKLLEPHADTSGHPSTDTPADTSGDMSRPREREREKERERERDMSDLQSKSKGWLEANERGSTHRSAFEMENGDPCKWSELIEVGLAFRDCWGRNDSPRTSTDSRTVTILSRFAEGYVRRDLARALKGAKQDEHIARNRQFQAIVTILRDAAQVDKFASLLAPNAGGLATREEPPAPPDGLKWSSHAWEGEFWNCWTADRTRYSAKPGERAKRVTKARAAE